MKAMLLSTYSEGGYSQLDKITAIEAAIDQKRSELNQIGSQYDLETEIVIKTSKELDELLNEYIRMNKAR
ncbi:hypothetical protein YDYSY3_38560 [Paenibacillus chitinolyticus]|uniref:aspartyl-phosphate phosphatase Spo0E family protein n=1 Tax=Paenibacillus chitinolyticus TaxID=79263 RepID=UPI0026E4F162|nr:aspartyl-phosphate phosphatase Spo0E family protein [Paenibacillus chitinolyticus]GKS12856.1 hypothetical protein YDYSY3_38560 [Paenibacillus chitinolyticus]